MDKQQNAWYDMYLDVMAIVDANESVWEEKEFFATPYNLFVAKYGLIEAPRVIQLRDTTGSTDVKNTRRTALVEQTQLFSRALNSYSLSNDLEELKKVTYRSPSDIERMDDYGLLGFARILTEEATPRITSLTDLGITLAKLTAYNAAQSSFATIFVPQTKAKEAHMNATQDLAKLFETCNSILNKQLDPQAAVFADLHPEFYQQYTNVRRITDPATRTRALTLHVADASTNTPIPKLDITIPGTGVKKKTSEQGNIWVQNMAPGEYTIQCSMPGYLDKTVTAYIVDGVTTRLVVLMEKK